MVISDKHGGSLATPEVITKLVGEFSRARVYFNGFLLGNMGPGDFTISKDQDIKEVVYGDAPAGTKYSKRVQTGVNLAIKFILAGNALSMQSLSILDTMISDENDGQRDSSVISAENYVELVRGPMKIVAVDSAGKVSSDISDVLSLYEVELNMSDLFKWNSSEAQTWEVSGVIYPKQFSLQEEQLFPGVGTAFGYIGDNEKAKVPKMHWPDKVEPIIIKAETKSSKTIEVTFSKPVKLAASDKPFAEGVKVMTQNYEIAVASSSGIGLDAPTTTATVTVTPNLSAADEIVLTLLRGYVVGNINKVPNQTYDYNVTNMIQGAK